MAVSGDDLFVANYIGGRSVFAVGGSITEVNVSSGNLVRVISGKAYGFDHPIAMALFGEDLFVANNPVAGGGGWVTELSASTGALARVISGPAYHFDWPTDLVLRGNELFASNNSGNSVTEFRAST